MWIPRSRSRVLLVGVLVWRHVVPLVGRERHEAEAAPELGARRRRGAGAARGRRPARRRRPLRRGDAPAAQAQRRPDRRRAPRPARAVEHRARDRRAARAVRSRARRLRARSPSASSAACSRCAACRPTTGTPRAPPMPTSRWPRAGTRSHEPRRVPVLAAHDPRGAGGRRGAPSCCSSTRSAPAGTAAATATAARTRRPTGSTASPGSSACSRRRATRSRCRAARRGSQDEALLVLTPQLGADGERLAEIIEARRHLGPTLVILPKWFAIEASQAARGRRAEGLGRARRRDGARLARRDRMARWMPSSRSSSASSGRAWGWRAPCPLPRAALALAAGSVGDRRWASLVPLVTDEDGDVLAGYFNDDGDYPVLDDAAGYDPPRRARRRRSGRW